MPTRANQYACHVLSVCNIFNKRPKFTFRQSKRFPPKHNLPDKKKHFIGTSSILARGKSHVLPTDPPILHRSDNNYGRPLHGT